MLRVTRDQLIGLDRSYLPTAARARRGKHLVMETVTCTVSPFLTRSIAVDGVDAGYTLPVTIRPSDPAQIPDTVGTYIRFDTAWDDNGATNPGL